MSAFPDFSAARTRTWWSGLVATLSKRGVSGLWIDMNEPASFDAGGVPDTLAVDGDGRATTMAELHNAYAYFEAKASYEGMQATRPTERPFVLSRAAFAGQQKWSAVWTGDAPSTWTTLGMDANWMFMLVRTDKAARKQEGISFLLVDLKSRGVTVRPIINLDLHDEFCEVFFDNVRVPRTNLVGEPNKGWSIAKSLLGFERIFLGSPRQAEHALSRLALLADRLRLRGDPLFEDRFTCLALDLEDLKSLHARFADQLRRGETLGPDVSMLKVIQTELYQSIAGLMMEVSGGHAGLLDPADGEGGLNMASLYLQSRPASIYGGSNEIQRDILAKAVLDLP
jgi:alkylation response protein AidB-like acyl-CoA dehydrogenase